MSNIFTEDENKQVAYYISSAKGLKIRPSGQHKLFIQCPFHKDNTPSFKISTDTSSCYCFSCGWKGTINQLAKETVDKSSFAILNKEYNEDFDFLQAVQKRIQQEEDFTKTPDVKVNVDGIMSRLNAPCIEYLNSRYIDLNIAKKYSFKFLDRGNVNDMPIYNRLMIPVKEKNRIISYECRDITGQSKKKVLYPPNSSVNTLYDLDNLNKDEPLFLVEGLMDLFILRSYSYFKNSTSMFGSNPTNRKAALLSTFKHIIFIPDNDIAGYSSVEQYKNKIASNVKIEVMPIPVNRAKDVGDLPKLGYDIAKRLSQWETEKVSVFSYLTKYKNAYSNVKEK